MSASALDKLIASTSNHWPTLTPKARSELAQLRADLQAAQERSAEQARQLEEARDILQVLHDTQHSIKSQFAARKKAKNWLSSNPAQPQEQP